jgi:hypothetical protein
LKIVAVFLAVAATLIALYGGWIWWDVQHVRAFCHDLAPGEPISDIPVAAERNGVNAHWQDGGPGVMDKRTNDWFLPVWAVSTFGDITCRIHHNRVSIVSAVMSDE